MNTQIILASLKARPVRTVVAVLAVVLEVTLILLLVGLTTGSLNETGQRVAGVGADIIFQSENASYMLAMSSATMPIKTAEILAGVEGVAAVAPVVTTVNPGGGFNIIYGIDPVSFDAVSGGFTYQQGGPFKQKYEALVDDWYANAEMVTPGSEITLKNQKFTVSGIVDNGKGARIFIPIQTAQEMEGREGKASLFYIKAWDKAAVPAVIQRLKSGRFEGNQVTDVDEFAALLMASYTGLLDTVFNVIVFIGLSIGVLVIFLSMYTTITERTREIGILRSLGGSKGFIVALILQEAVLLCAVGVVVGTGASFLLARLIKYMFPMVVIMITNKWLIQAAVFALLSGVIGSLYPAIKAAAKDPVEALAYE
jgi:putative ABC transport system permease protein